MMDYVSAKMPVVCALDWADHLGRTGFIPGSDDPVTVVRALTALAEEVRRLREEATKQAQDERPFFSATVAKQFAKANAEIINRKGKSMEGILSCYEPNPFGFRNAVVGGLHADKVWFDETAEVVRSVSVDPAQMLWPDPEPAAQAQDEPEHHAGTDDPMKAVHDVIRRYGLPD